ncbi:putative nicotinate-nucleotide pyrophosphorylase [carboxylating] [Pseudovibrio sp. Ad13]|uniref:carboxylating nicotinate-nucleotide diphosphorylase n=1 Tax=unclassified Pseudovibrio TaxID=2627060 RepID=UPI0007AE6C85|nr:MULTISPECIES: carboxylating nicotinate-nucleotide diphosphorylase [unclassified Pseudovibrio]KZK85219.1 putative nicotinate-nucleotide pyrophosphorylase [carboxylating] [Pseudovibrio sp. Ad13]KZK91482.1 putative nicotinate-nucleotide pyrophosphorylase [carboxylating] [Pseudovibrio sp. Ad46]
MSRPSSLPELSLIMVDDAVKAALLEDFGRAGDITSQATIPADAVATGVIAARKDGVLAGIDLALSAFRQVDPTLDVTVLAQDGDKLEPGTIIARIHGPARALLEAERVALNFLSHLSGIASATNAFQRKISHTNAKVVCTRKTTPGLRSFEKYAVRCGGGMNHRFGLDDAILIKDNHIAVAGGVVPAIESARAFAGHLVRIEVEVDTLDQLKEALTAKPDVVMLDNMGPDLLRQAVEINKDQAVLEASGTITLSTIQAIAEAGVDIISSGWITHSAPILDLGLDIEID